MAYHDLPGKFDAQHSVIIFGKIIKANNSSPVYNEGLTVFAEDNGKVISECDGGEDGQSCVSGKDGYFVMNVKYEKHQSYDVFVNTDGIRRLYLGSFTPEGDSVNLRLTIPATFQKDKKGHAICPKCHKSDLTFKLIYSCTIYKLGPREALGPAGTPTPANYWCRRESIYF